MKKITLVILLIAATTAVNAQEFKIGLGGGIYSTWLTNTNVSDQSDIVDFAATFGGQIGMNAQYYFKDNLAVNFGLLFTGHNQKYAGDLGDFGGVNFSYETKTKMRYLDIPFLLRMGGGTKGAYFEFGPQFGILMSAQEDFTSDPANSSSGMSGTTLDHTGRDVKDNFESSNIAGILGFGVDIDASENVIVTTGLRLGYGFTAATKEYSETTFESLGAAEKIGFSSGWGHTTDDGKFKYKSTNQRLGFPPLRATSRMNCCSSSYDISSGAFCTFVNVRGVKESSGAANVSNFVASFSCSPSNWRR